MAVSLYLLAVDAHDLKGLATFWARVLDWRIVHEDDEEVIIAADENARPGIIFLSVPEEKAGKNRLHIDLAPDDQAAEVERIIGLGARRVDVGQGEVSWVVLADPNTSDYQFYGTAPPGTGTAESPVRRVAERGCCLFVGSTRAVRAHEERSREQAASRGRGTRRWSLASRSRAQLSTQGQLRSSSGGRRSTSCSSRRHRPNERGGTGVAVRVVVARSGERDRPTPL